MIKKEIQQILTDIKEALQNKRTPLIITKFKEHAQYIYEQLQGRSDHIFLLVGGKGHKRIDKYVKNSKILTNKKVLS
mgnify:CR=1 FL=1